MNKVIVLVLLALGCFSGCTGKTPYGKCIGLNGVEDPKLRYEYHAWNIFEGLFFSETIIAPLVVALDRLKCPVGEAVTK